MKAGTAVKLGLLITILLLLTPVIHGFAAVVNSVDIQGEKLTVQGNLSQYTPAQIVGVYILKEGKAPADIAGAAQPGDVFDQIGMAAVDDNGKYTCQLICSDTSEKGSLYVKSGAEEILLPVENYKSPGRTLYVAPDGNDLAPGTKDEPLATLTGARDLIRAWRAERGELLEAVTVYIMPGEYRMTETAVFTREDSGTAECPITYRAYAPGTVTFKGSVKLPAEDFRQVTDRETLQRLPIQAAGRVYQMDLGNYGITPDQVQFKDIWGRDAFSQAVSPAVPGLYLNGKRQDIARWPNVGYADFSLPDGSSAILDPGEEQGRGAVFYFREPNLQRWITAKDMFIDGYLAVQYAGAYRRVKAIDPEAETIALVGGVIAGPERRWTAVNLLEELDMPGEFYIDRDNMRLYYYPAYDLTETDVLEYAAMQTPLIQLENVSYMQLQDLDFAQVYAAGITGSGIDHIQVSDCEISFTAGHGIWFSDARNTEVTGCTVHNTGGNGIVVDTNTTQQELFSLTACGNRIINNHVYNVSDQVRTMGSGISGNGVGLLIQNNLVHLSPNMGASGGGAESEVSYNELYNLIRDTADAGGVYIGRTLISYGNRYAFNYIHDMGIEGFLENEHTSGIFWDDFLSGQTAENNIIVNDYPGTAYGININGGRDLRVNGNIFVGMDYAVRNTDRSNQPVDQVNFMPEIVEDLKWVAAADSEYTRKYPQMVQTYREIQEDGKFNPKNMDFSGNIVFNCRQAAAENGGVFTNGRIAGEFSDTVNIDNFVTKNSSIFVDPKQGDYRLTEAGKAAAGLQDFVLDEDFDLDTIGFQGVVPLGDGFRKTYPQNGAAVGGGITLAWEQALFADEYVYTVSENPDLSDPIYQGITIYRHAELFGLEPGKTYYWNVTARHTSRKFAGAWESGPVYSFRTTTCPVQVQDMQAEASADALTVTMRTYNGSAEAAGTLLLAGYQPDGSLAGVTAAKITVPAGAAAIHAVARAVPEAVDYTAFLWDGIDTMQPLGDCKIYVR